MKLPPALRKGDRFRLIPNGPICEVVRVSPTAAYVQKVYDPPRIETFVDKHGKEHRIKVSRGPIEPGISTHSFVYPLEEEKT